MKKQSGFTLIELMIVVAIVAILAAIALPAYQTYTKKAKFSEVVASTGAFKTAIEACYSAEDTLENCTEGQNGVPTLSTNYPSGLVDSLSVSGATSTAISIMASGADALAGETYELNGTVSGGHILWVASGTCKSSGLCN